MRETDILREVLKKYDLVLPVLPREQRRIYRSKRRTLASVLGVDRRSTLFTSSVVRFYYMMRNSGMNITLAGAARGAVFAAVTAVLLFTGGGILLFQNYFHTPVFIAGKAPVQDGYIAAAGDMKLYRNGVESLSVEAPYKVEPGDEIVTGDSSALLQFDNGAVVKVMRKSSLLVVSIGPQYRFDLRGGGVVSRVPRLAEGAFYEVHTPDAVVSVKGTEFGVIYGDSKTTVFVAEGTVRVKHIPGGAEYDVSGGNSTEVNGEKRVNVLTEGEAVIMKGFSGFHHVESLNGKNRDELKAISEMLAAADRAESQGTAAKRMTLAELKEKYGRLDEVILYSGRRYTGVIISRGGVYKILTAGGIVSVPAKEIKGSGVIQ